MLLHIPRLVIRFLLLWILLSWTIEGSQNPLGAFSTISTSMKRFNLDEKLNLFAFVQASSTVSASWSAEWEEKQLQLNSLTPGQIVIPEADATSLFSFPLSIPPYSFLPDGDVTFRLTVSGVGAAEGSVLSTSKVTLFVNGPPVGGHLDVFPRVGTALETLFLASTTDWSDESSDYPLTYGYSYIIDPQQPHLQLLHHLNDRSILKNLTTILPLGREHSDYSLTLLVRVYDSSLACANASITVRVYEPHSRLNQVQFIVKDRLRKALLHSKESSRRSSATTTAAAIEALTLVSSAANVLNHKNCSLVSGTHCAGLNRQPCWEVAQTCGACLEGFRGVVGPSNHKCHRRQRSDVNTEIAAMSSSSRSRIAGVVVGDGSLGSVCRHDEDCDLGLCSFASSSSSGVFGGMLWGPAQVGQCAAPALSCPSANEEVCSGRGSCVFVDHSLPLKSLKGNNNTTSSSNGSNNITSTSSCGFIRESCSVADLHCAAVCRCSPGYGGSDCSLTLSELQTRSETRVSLCRAILKAAEAAHPSALLLESLVTSLEVSFRRDEVPDAEGRAVCLEALWLVSQLAEQNNQLRHALSHTSGRVLLQTASRFVPLQLPDPEGVCEGHLPPELLTEEPEGLVQEGLQTGDILTEVVSNVASLVLKSIPNGHTDVILVADRIRMTVIRDALFKLEGRVLSPPPSELESLLNRTQPSITFTSSASDDCNAGEGYVQMSISSWTRSPYRNSSHLVTPLFRSEAFVSSSATSHRRQQQRGYTGEGDEVLWDQSDPILPDYFITLPFHRPQAFLDPDTLELDDEGSPLPFQNETFPVCHYYVGETYVPCGNCNISSYDNLTVTYACTDVSFVCGLEGMNSRLDYDESHFSALEIPYGSEASSSSGDGNRTYYYSGTQGSYYASNGGVTLAQLAAIVYDIRISFAKILSTFRFRMINFKVDAPMLTFVFSLAFGIVCGFILFYRWDRFDHDELIYANINAKNRRAERLKKTEMIKKKNMKLVEKKVIHRRWFSRNNFVNLLNKRRRRAVDDGEKRDLPDHWEAQQIHKQTMYEYYNILSDLTIDLNPDPYIEALEADPIEYFIDAAVPGHDDFSVLDQRAKQLSEAEAELEKRAKERRGSSEEEQQQQQLQNGEITLTSIGAALGVDLTAEKSAALALAAVWQTTTFFNTVLYRHDYFAIFNRYTGSLGQTRVLRFSSLSLKILLCLLLDTLFFSVFFPDTGLCESFKTKADCLERFNLASNSNLCSWTKPVYRKHPGHCSLAPPPQNVFFTLMVVLVTVICAAPVNIMFNNLRLKICSKRPDIEALGLDVNFWLNSSSQVIHDVTMSLLEFNAHKNAVPINEEAVEEERMQHPGVVMRKGTVKINTNPNKVRVDVDEIDFITRREFEKSVSAAAEAEYLYSSIVAYGRSNANHAELTWGATVDETKRKEARIRAMDRELHVNLHGVFTPLTLKQYMFYGTARRRIIAKLHKARQMEKEISEQLENIDEYDYHDRDTLLLQRFVLEQFTATKRYCLRRQLFNFRSSTPFKINPILWAAGWMMMFLFMLFFMYWILAWGVLSGKKTFKSWGWNFGLQFAQDVLVTEVLKMYVLYVISMFSMKPQLNHIYRKLNHLAILSQQEDSSEIRERMNEIRVVQYLSPSCRVARREHAVELAGAKILRQMDDIDSEDCQKDSHIRMNVLGYMFFGIASIIAMYSDFWSDFVMEVTIPCVSIGFVLASYYLYKATITTFASFFFFVVCCLLLKRYYDQLKAKDMMRRRLGLNNSVNLDPAYLHHNSSSRRRKSRKVRYYCFTYKEFEALLVRWFDFIRWVYKLRHFRFNEQQLRRQRKEDNQWKQINSIYSQSDNMDCLPLSEVLNHTSVHIPKEIGRLKAADSKSVHYRGGVMEKKRPPDFITQMLNRHLLNCGADCGMDTSSHAESVDSLWEDSPTHSKASSPVQSTRSGRSNSSHRSRAGVDLLFEPAFDVEKLAVFADDTEKRWPLIRPMMYRFTHQRTSNPTNALVRMFHKHLGKISQLQDRIDASDGSEEVERYFRQITQYQSYDDTVVSTEAFALIMQEIFSIYEPGGRHLTRAEIAETLEMFEVWRRDNPYPADATPCGEFIKWFLALKECILKGLRQESHFDVENVHDAYGASKNTYRRRRVVIEYSDGSMSSTSESFVNTDDGSVYPSSESSSVSSYSTQSGSGSSSSGGGYSYHSSDFSSDDSRRLHVTSGGLYHSSETSSNSYSPSQSNSSSRSSSYSRSTRSDSYSGSSRG